MDEARDIELHKKLLLKEVSAFCRRDPSSRKASGDFLNDELENTPQREALKSSRSIHPTIKEIKDRNWQAVFFGGMLRSLLVSKLDPTVARRPRDIDIVIKGAKIDEVEEVFRADVSRKTRFGGLQLRRVQWQFDVWPLEETQALLEDSMLAPSFADLPETTFFNVEAVAVDVWPRPGKSRRIYSGDDQFFRSIIERTIEINREENPYPDLCVVRSLVMAANLKWKVGPRLLEFLRVHGQGMSPGDFEAIQEKHYGRIQFAGALFSEAIRTVMNAKVMAGRKPVELPLPSQLTLWPEEDLYTERIRLRAIKATRAKSKD